ncbi:MAG TPA: hypothetical protein VG297_23990 [Bryobacteraceae bacterium]|nr:hypothetical protein [Bryobacteraceae bacterium]
MPRVRIIHWKAKEAAELIGACRACGCEVEYLDADFPAQAQAIRANPPDALVIDLTCRPAQGRGAASAFRQSKYARHIPLIFVGGEPEKIAAVRERLPDATYATSKQLCAKVRAACAKPVVNPVIPPDLTETYKTRTVAQKLGIKAASTVAVIDAPRDYTSALGVLPEDVDLLEDPDSVHPVTLWFVRDPRIYQAGMHRMQALAGRTKLWVVWRKNSTNGLTQYVVRDTALDAGLVDYKICALHQDWSGMAFARRKK